MTPELACRETRVPPTPFSAFGRVFDDFFGRGWQGDDGNDRLLAPALDITEDEHSFSIAAELPGLKKEDVQIHFENGVLAISGEKRHESESKEKSWHRMERRYGSFYRAITLPPGVEVDRVDATFENGVLRITVPKAEAVKPKAIKIK